MTNQEAISFIKRSITHLESAIVELSSDLPETRASTLRAIATIHTGASIANDAAMFLALEKRQ